MKLTSVLGVPVVLTVCVCSLSAADNVILFIGDGMGFDHVKAGRVLTNGSSATPLGFEGLGYAAQSITVLPNGTVTDSATAGTALATGYQHPANGVISMGADGSIKTTILELAKAKGFRTGIITTDDIGGATPGAFGAHEPDRTYMADIRYDYLLDDPGPPSHPASRPDVLLGGGYNNSDYLGRALFWGYSFAATASELQSAPRPLLGLFGTAWAPMTAMAYRASNTTQPRLSEMVAKALSLLDNDQGFFLVVESANIDKLSHSNDPNFVFEVPELDVAVQAALAWRNSHPNDNTLILVTADHETGALTVPDQTQSPVTVPSMTWGSTGHSARNVPVYATWPASLDGLTVDNTEIFFILEDYLNISSGSKPPVITGLTVLGITETSATVQWDTVEPSTTSLYDGDTLISGNSSRVTRHTVVCGGLLPDTQYQFTASSEDIAGNTGSVAVSFSTTTRDFNARVLAEPLAAIGVVSGTIAGVAAPDDGLTQLVTEAPSGAGSRVLVEYTLHTSASPGAIENLTLDGNVSWTGRDGAAEELITEVRVTLPNGVYGWQPITLPFQAKPPSSYVDAKGDIVVRFSDTASIKRERKDTLAVDYLVGEVVLGSTTPEPPTAPGSLTAGTVTANSVTLNWENSELETGYLIWRYTAESGWMVVAELAKDVVTYPDSGLTPGMSYTYAVRAFNAAGFADSALLKIETVAGLVAPQNLTASAGKGVIKLTWTDSNTLETAYEVLRGTTSDGNFESLAALPANATSYSDTSVGRGTKYFYQVRALKGNVAGPVSATVSATPR